MNITKIVPKLIYVMVIMAAFAAGSAFAPHTEVAAQSTVVLTPVEQLMSDVYNHVSPSVVAIVVEERIAGNFEPTTSGSGFVVDKLGHIATNFHVVDGAGSEDRIVVNFLDGTIVAAEVIGLDPDADVAVLQVDLPEERLFPVVFGDSNQVVIGQTSLAIGSPFRQRWTLTSGIVSALDRSIDGLANFRTGGVIQTDTAINPGSSGGPLLNLQGEVIGVNTQILSEDRANVGIGFAVPSNLVQRAVNELIELGEVRYSYLGISGDDVDLNYIERLGLENNVRGVVVTLVQAGRPGEEGGLLNPEFSTQGGQRRISSADIIIAIEDRQIPNFSTLLGYIAINTVPGDVITLTVLRDGELIELPVMLGSRR